MQRSLEQIVAAYGKDVPLERASTIPAAWYTDARVSELERSTVFKRSWQVAGRRDAVRAPGDYIACELAGGEPIVVSRADDRVLRAFFNVCRHHAAAVVTDAFTAEMARRHNDAQVASFGTRVVPEERILELAGIFLATPFDGGRHEPRVKKIAAYEEKRAR